SCLRGSASCKSEPPEVISGGFLFCLKVTDCICFSQVAVRIVNGARDSRSVKSKLLQAPRLQHKACKKCSERVISCRINLPLFLPPPWLVLVRRRSLNVMKLKRAQLVRP